MDDDTADELANARRKRSRNRDLLIFFITIGTAISWAVWMKGGVSALLAKFDKSDGAIAVCEQIILSTLQSPASYDRVSADYTPDGPLGEKEYGEFLANPWCEIDGALVPCGEGRRIGNQFAANVQLDQQGVKNRTRRQLQEAMDDWVKASFEHYRALPAEKQRTAFVKIEYDAANAFGALLRNTHVCRFGPKRTDRFTLSSVIGPYGDPAAPQ